MGKKRKKGTPQITDAMASVLSETPAPLQAEANLIAPPEESFALTPEPPLVVTTPDPIVLAKEPLPTAPVAPAPVVHVAEPKAQPALTEIEAAEIISATPISPVEIASTPADPLLGVRDVPPAADPSTAVEEAPVSMAPASEMPASEVSASVAPTSEAAPSTARPKRRKKKRTTKPPAAGQARDVLDQKIGRLEAKLEVKKEEAAKAAREGFGSPAVDDQSVPPVDLEVHDEFFAAGEKGPVTRDASGAFSALDARHAQKMTAAAHARRAHLSRYVKWAVGGSAALLLAAITVNKLRRPEAEPARREVVHAAQVVGPQEQVAQIKPVDVPPAVVELGDQGNLDDKKVDDTKVDDKAEEVKDDTDKKPDELPPEKPKNAWQEKQTAKAALERGANGVAVSSGERSVALDASDGEAWLVLGAAYQAMGNTGQAKRCFNACVTQGKKGPIGDCRDMLSAL